MKKLTAVIFCMLMWSGQAFADCTATITATTPTADFVDHGNGTVTHAKTGLMWKQCSEGLSGAGCTGVATTHTWQQALQLAEALNAGAGFAEHTDWRLPNQKELNSIVERQCINPTINVTIFPNTVSTWFWSASPYAGDATGAWGVVFSGGYDGANFKSANNYVRLVRGGR